MIEIIDKLTEIAKAVDNHTYDMQLMRMREMLEKNEYLVSVMGQFSAGKSRLINNLAEKKIVPVHATETTALVTLIKYGTNEYVELIYKDGKTEEITIEQSLDLWQDGKSDVLGLVEMIIIYVNSPILSSGMVLADTPGINTIINEHVELAANIMDSSDRIMYVMGKPATETDIHFIEKIKNCGLSILMVRTHMDYIKITEENLSVSTKKEIELLQPYTDDKIFFISNDEDSIYFTVVGELREYLQTSLADNIEEVIRITCRDKINRIAIDEQHTVEDMYNSVQHVLSGQESEYKRKKKELEEILSKMNNIFEKNSVKLHKQAEQTKNNAKIELEHSKNMAIQEIKNILKEANLGNNPEAYGNLIKKSVDKKCEKIKNNYIKYFDKMLGENKKELVETLSSYQIGNDFMEYIPENFEDTSEKIEEIRGKITALKIAEENCDKEIAKLENKKGEHIQEKEGINAEIEQIKIIQQNIKRELDEYPEYEVQYNIIQEETHNTEDMMRRIGNAIDWITILLPGKAYVNIGGKALGKMGKVAGKIPKAGNIAKKLTKAEKTLKKTREVKKIINKVDKVTDTAKAMKDMIGNKGENEDNGISKVLQFFTLEHHLGNLGKKFDKDEIKEIDREYERKYRMGKNEIENRMKLNAQEELRKKTIILNIDNKIKKAKMEEEIYQNKRNAAEREINGLEQQLIKEKEKEIIKSIKKYYAKEGTENIEELCRIIMAETDQQVERSIEDYISASSIGIISKIREKENELEQLEGFLTSASREELEEKAGLYSSYNKYLSGLLQNG